MESLNTQQELRVPRGDHFALTEEQILAGALGYGMCAADGEFYPYVLVDKDSDLLSGGRLIRTFRGKIVVSNGEPTKPEWLGQNKNRLTQGELVKRYVTGEGIEFKPCKYSRNSEPETLI